MIDMFLSRNYRCHRFVIYPKILKYLKCSILTAILLTSAIDQHSPAQAATIYVDNTCRGPFEDGSAPHPFRTVKKAIAAAADGDSIVIQAGEYFEPVLFNKNVSVEAVGGAVTIRAGQVLNENLSLAFDLCNGITLTSIYDPVTRHEYLTAPTFFFKFAVNNGAQYESNNRIVVDSFSLASDGSQLDINAHATNVDLAFFITIGAASQDSAAILRMRITNTGPNPVFLRTVMPAIQGLATAGNPEDMMGTVPQEIGSVVRLREDSTNPTPMNVNCAVDPTKRAVYLEKQSILGMDFNICIGLPTAMNTMELASIYDRAGGGGIFFADIEGELDTAPNALAPIQFTLSPDEMAGFWIADIQPAQSVNTPALAVGVHHQGDWHHAVDYYVSKHAARWSFPAIPQWFRDQGAIYSFAGGGAGGIYLNLPLSTRVSFKSDAIPSFYQLPNLLTEARQLGTNIIYIWDYWEGTALGGLPPYFNKGDYIPRDDMGGSAALKDGIRAVHDQGGKVLMYLEPFIIYQYSQIAFRFLPVIPFFLRDLWGGLDPLRNLYRHYDDDKTPELDNYTMVAPFVPWQDEVVSIAQRLVRDYGADGILLDSWGWQMNWPMTTLIENKLYSPKEYSQGVLTLADRVRAAVQAIKRDAVVIGETTSGPLSHHWDGGLSADFAWLKKRNRNRIIASPVRYGMPQVNFISNGTNLNELHQIFAAGHSLALCCNFPGEFINLPHPPDSPPPPRSPNFIYENAAEIKNLVCIRQTYKDALIYGAQSYQPVTGDKEVAAYFYQGAQNRIITIVNTKDTPYEGSVILKSSEANSQWRDITSEDCHNPGSGNVIQVQGQGQLPISVPAQGLRVLLKQ